MSSPTGGRRGRDPPAASFMTCPTRRTRTPTRSWSTPPWCRAATSPTSSGTGALGTRGSPPQS
eukprot:15433428-Alexandrium_andersonii.AAC.1